MRRDLPTRIQVHAKKDPWWEYPLRTGGEIAALLLFIWWVCWMAVS